MEHFPRPEYAVPKGSVRIDRKFAKMIKHTLRDFHFFLTEIMMCPAPLPPLSGLFPLKDFFFDCCETAPKYRVFKMSIEITNKYRKNYRNIYYDCKDIDGFEFATVKNFSDSVLAICRASLGTMRKKVNYFRTVYCEALKTLRKSSVRVQ